MVYSVFADHDIWSSPPQYIHAICCTVNSLKYLLHSDFTSKEPRVKSYTTLDMVHKTCVPEPQARSAGGDELRQPSLPAENWVSTVKFQTRGRLGSVPVRGKRSVLNRGSTVNISQESDVRCRLAINDEIDFFRPCLMYWCTCLVDDAIACSWSAWCHAAAKAYPPSDSRSWHGTESHRLWDDGAWRTTPYRAPRDAHRLPPASLPANTEHEGT